jgi:hypothetical protein
VGNGFGTSTELSTRNEWQSSWRKISRDLEGLLFHCLMY